MGPRKQRYVLDHDDVVRRALMTKPNSEELVGGLNESGSETLVATKVGGTNNDDYVDQELLIYDASSKRFISSGSTVETIGLHSIFVPHTTGVKINGGAANQMVSADSIVVAESQFLLPGNSLWVELDIKFDFFLKGSTSTMNNLAVILGNDFGQDPAIVSSYPGPYASVDDNDSLHVSWSAMGLIPSLHSLDNPFSIKIKAVPNDVVVYRRCIVRVGYRSVVATGGGGTKGVPTFLPVPIDMITDSNGAWHTFNLTNHVPEGASAVIIHGASAQSERADVYATLLRTEAGRTEYLLVATTTENDEDDKDTAVNQGLFPYKSLAGVRSIDYFISNGVYERLELKLIGYIT